MTPPSFYIRVQSAPASGANHARSFGGKTVAANWTRLTAAARQLGIKSLEDFVGTPTKENPGAAQRWFLPQEGLTSIRRLISTISSNTRAYDHSRNLIRDLQSYENILAAAESRGSRFHFSPDIETQTSV